MVFGVILTVRTRYQAPYDHAHTLQVALPTAQRTTAPTNQREEHHVLCK